MQQLELAGASAVPNLSHDEWLDTLKEPGFMSELWPAQHLLGHSGVLRGASDAAACAPRVKRLPIRSIDEYLCASTQGERG